MSSASYSLHGPVAVITLDNPPVNGLGLALRQAIVAGIDAAASDPAVQAVVLIGNERFFSGGADVREFGTPKAMQEPTLLTVIRTIERSPKPVIAAVSGVCMGGGLELALGCHFRIAHTEATVALPEVKLELLPGAGGTQRLPRVVGLETALNMIVSGAQVPVTQLKHTALFDEVVTSELLPAALALAHKVVSEGRGLPRVRDAAGRTVAGRPQGDRAQALLHRRHELLQALLELDEVLDLDPHVLAPPHFDAAGVGSPSETVLSSPWRPRAGIWLVSLIDQPIGDLLRESTGKAAGAKRKRVGSGPPVHWSRGATS